MPADTRHIRERLLARNNFTEEQADDLLDALFDEKDPVVTESVFASRLRKQTITILFGVFAMNAMFLGAAALL